MTRIEEIASSRARLTIASLISSRPRSLSELAEVTGISVQGALKHLKKLSEAGILEEENMPQGEYLRPRKLYFIRSRKVEDYSQEDVLIATLGRAELEEGSELGRTNRNVYQQLDELAQDVIVSRRRVRELSKRMQRLIEELADAESRVSALISSLDLTRDEKQIAYLIFGDDPPERVSAILREHYGCTDPAAAIREVSQKIRKARAG